jgi:predicted O-methyltransferase YrrM
MEDLMPPHMISHPSLYDTLRLVVALAKPSAYLEIGVRDGHSLREVILAGGNQIFHFISPRATLQRLALCDDWGDQSGGTGKGGHGHIEQLLAELHYQGQVQWIDGNSHELLKPAIELQSFDLILVDGDHTEQGAAQDLRDCIGALAPQGLLLFDDIGHPAHPYLEAVLQAFLSEHPELELICEPHDPFSGVSVMRRR